MSNVQPRIHPSWERLLKEEFEADYFTELIAFIEADRKVAEVYPPREQVFAAFDRTPIENVKVVIIGQDPYHGQGQANGLCFSVNDGVRHPPSLRNIFKELQNDLGLQTPKSGNLERWADSGVLLLNATLTVRESKPNSHQKCGWNLFTDSAIQRLSEIRDGLAFLLWGSFAQQKEALIAKDRGHLILKSPHPSPFSAHKGFFGCKHFSQVNTFLRENSRPEMDWSLGQ